MKRLFSYLLLLILFSCGSEDEGLSISEDEGSFIASYKDNNLTLEEVKEGFLNKPPSIDSANFMNQYVEDWILNQIILDKAKLYIDENDKGLQSELNAYKNTLIINRYQDELINNQFDTTVLKSDIEKYYTNHQKDFILRKNIVKARLVIMSKETLNLKKVKSLMVTDDNLEMNELSEFCRVYSENSFLNDSVWIYFSDFYNELPISEKQSKNIFSKKNKLHSFQDDNFIFLFFVKDYRIKGEESPLSLNLNKIREKIRIEKIRKSWNKLKEEFRQEALSSEYIKIYKK